AENPQVSRYEGNSAITIRSYSDQTLPRNHERNQTYSRAARCSAAIFVSGHGSDDCRCNVGWGRACSADYGTTRADGTVYRARPRPGSDDSCPVAAREVAGASKDLMRACQFRAAAAGA